MPMKRNRKHQEHLHHQFLYTPKTNKIHSTLFFFLLLTALVAVPLCKGDGFMDHCNRRFG
jgi:hypothetical protein